MTESIPAGGLISALQRVNAAWRFAIGQLERLSIYLPMVMMGLLAVGTYWLVRNTPVVLPPEAPRLVGHELDYFMRRATIKTFDEAGRLKTEIYGSEARHFADTETLEMDQVRLRSLGVDGRVTTASARQALSNDAGSEIKLIGDAVVVREALQDLDGNVQPRLEFRGEFLHIFLNEERVKSHLPVIIRRGEDQLSGDSLNYDRLEQVVQLQGRVKGMLIPPKASSPALPRTPR
jgi:lipopolysaccharide export system protein LptC